MSIYATMWTVLVESGEREAEGKCGPEAGVHFNDMGEEFVEVYAQAVPGHIYYAGPIWDDWMPPPVWTPAHERYWECKAANGRPCVGCREYDGKVRAVFICGPETLKGTDRNGQEYVNPVVVFSGEEYYALNFGEVLERIEAALPTHFARARRQHVTRKAAR